jgi:hypothetical protein
MTPVGFEPTTIRLKVECSTGLSYRVDWRDGNHSHFRLLGNCFRSFLKLTQRDCQLERVAEGLADPPVVCCQAEGLVDASAAGGVEEVDVFDVANGIGGDFEADGVGGAAGEVGAEAEIDARASQFDLAAGAGLGHSGFEIDRFFLTKGV